jgi:threonine aldolase
MKSLEFIDLRSDTVTLPTKEMFEAIGRANLGDDVFREDPTVNKLESLAAERMGKEAALLVPSGTQANLISLVSNCNRGELVFLESESHIFWYEAGGVSAIAGLLPWPLNSTKGVLDPEVLEAAIRPKNIHFPEPTLLCIENTHNRHGGSIIRPNEIRALKEVAEKHSMKLYMDGARIFNAAVGLNVDVKDFTRHVDNLMFCLSKGLSCPVGSIVVGSEEFIEKARKTRKILGGGMRQAGIIAAPGIVALETMIERLKEDHDNARLLGEKLSKIAGIRLNLRDVQSNIVTFDLDLSGLTDEGFLEKLRKDGVLALAQSKNRIRLVTHYGIRREQIEKTIAAVASIMENSS